MCCMIVFFLFVLIVYVGLVLNDVGMKLFDWFFVVIGVMYFFIWGLICFVYICFWKVMEV